MDKSICLQNCDDWQKVARFFYAPGTPPPLSSQLTNLPKGGSPFFESLQLCQAEVSRTMLLPCKVHPYSLLQYDGIPIPILNLVGHWEWNRRNGNRTGDRACRSEDYIVTRLRTYRKVLSEKGEGN